MITADVQSQVDELKITVEELKSQVADLNNTGGGTQVRSGILKIGNEAVLTAQRMGVEGVYGLLLEPLAGSGLYEYLFSSAGFAMPGGTFSGSVENTAVGGGIILKSPDATRWIVTVSNAGALVITAL